MTFSPRPPASGGLLDDRARRDGDHWRGRPTGTVRPIDPDRPANGPPATLARRPLPAARRDGALAERLPGLRAALERQREFRREQLARLDGHERPGGRDTATSVREVQAMVEAGARRALDDIELALARMRTGGYGRCRACGAGIALAVIEAIPQTTMCLRCHRRTDRAAGRVRAAHEEGARDIPARNIPVGSGYERGTG